MTILVTGGAGFIGSNFVLEWLKQSDEVVINVDALTYAGNKQNLDSLAQDSRHIFANINITDRKAIRELFHRHAPRAVVHLAAETHVDRSILSADAFIQSNIVGTFCLLEEARAYWNELSAEDKKAFRFLHVSTDEVYGTLEDSASAFSETHPYAPSNPYSASKASSDFLVRAHNHTYNFPTLLTNCSNNYGPFQFPEKLIPLVIANSLNNKELPIYGDGKQVRDWLYVKDHCSALRRVLEAGTPGETYNIGGRNQITNLSLVKTVCSILDQQRPRTDGQSYASLITHIKDRPGHDRRYAIDAGKIERELGWQPEEVFETGLEKTVLWYLGNKEWASNIANAEDHRAWLKRQYA